jgi:PmbA protein
MARTTKLKSRQTPRATSAGSGRSASRGSVDGRLGRAEIHRLAETIFRLSEPYADETEVEIGSATSALTRFANNTIHQNVAEQMVHVSVRTVIDGRTARASTNQIDDESLRRAVKSAIALTKCQPVNPSLLPMLKTQKYDTVRRYFKQTAEATAEDRARAVTQVCKMAAKTRQTAAGIFSTGHSQSALANSKGLFAQYEQTHAEFSVTVMQDDSSGWAKASSANFEDIEPEVLAESAGRKAAPSRNPRELPPGRYTTILGPSAVLDLVGFLSYDFAGTAVLDQRSCLTGRLGKKLFGENITIWDDVYHPLQLGPPYDGEGQPRQKVMLVDKGVPRNLVYARATAKKMKAKPSGHGFGLPNEYGEAPTNIVFAGGKASLDEMVESTERGILITRVWYIREVDPYEKILTGMTRDGSFLIENGRITGGIRNFRFNQSVIEMLSNVEMLGPAVRAAGEESFEMVVPAMKVRGFHFTEVTKF